MAEDVKTFIDNVVESLDQIKSYSNTGVVDSHTDDIFVLADDIRSASVKLMDTVNGIKGKVDKILEHDLKHYADRLTLAIGVIQEVQGKEVTIQQILRLQATIHGIESASRYLESQIRDTKWYNEYRKRSVGS